MQNPRFVVLTGHLNDYPLSDLVGILRHQRKTGRLLIEYPNGPATFYFQEGELVDAQVDKLSGLQAICVAMAQPGSPFNFNPLIAPTRRSVEPSLQRVVSELLGCWEESPLQIETATPPAPPEPLAIPASTSDESEVKALDVLPLPAIGPPMSNYGRVVLAMAAAGLMMLGLSTIIAVTGGFRQAESANQSSLVTETVPQPQPETQRPAQMTGLATETQAEPSEQIDGQKARRAPTTFEQPRTRGNQMLREAAANEAPVTRSTLATNGNAATNRNEGANVQSVDVVMQVENGRVLQASIVNSRSGMVGYEALALRIARQRRYPAKKSGQETVRIRVSSPD